MSLVVCLFNSTSRSSLKRLILLDTYDGLAPADQSYLLLGMITAYNYSTLNSMVNSDTDNDTVIAV